MQRVIAICLGGVLLSLLIVGIVSGTLLRHVIQVIPIALALLSMRMGYRLSACFALPLFVIWLLLMFLIGLYLLGVPTFFSGSFSPIEIVLTILIASFCIVGIAACIRSCRSSLLSHRILAALAFTVVQIAAMWLSFTPAFANR